jgi:hypothetical protein
VWTAQPIQCENQRQELHNVRCVACELWTDGWETPAQTNFTHGQLGLQAGPMCLLLPLGSVIRAAGCTALKCSTRLAAYIGHDGPAGRHLQPLNTTQYCNLQVPYAAVCAMCCRISGQNVLHQCGTIMTVVDWCSAALGERCRTLQAPRGVCCARLVAHSCAHWTAESCCWCNTTPEDHPSIVR